MVDINGKGEMIMNESYFDGTLLGLIGTRLLGGIITVITFGLAYPWAVTIYKKWLAEHTVVEGRRLQFNGKALDLFGEWIKWFLLTLITLGIYGFWVGIKMKQWVVKNTSFQN